MKYLIVCFLLITSSLAKSQDIFIGVDRTNINLSLTEKLGQKFVRTVSLNEKNSVDVYGIDSKVFLYIFFGKKDQKCNGVMESFVGRYKLFEKLEILNARYEKVEDGIWISKDLNTKITLKMEEDGYSVEYINVNDKKSQP